MRRANFSTTLKSMNYRHAITKGKQLNEDSKDNNHEEEKMSPTRTLSRVSQRKATLAMPLTPVDMPGKEEAPTNIPEMSDEQSILKLFHNFNFEEEEEKEMEDPSLMMAVSLSATNDTDTVFYYQVYNTKKDKVVCSLKNKYETNFSKKNLSFLCKKGAMSEYSANNLFIVRTSEFAVYAIFAGHGPFGYYPSYFCQLRFSMLIQKRKSELAEFRKEVLTKVFQEIFKTIDEELQAKASSTEEKRDMMLFSGTSITVVVQHFKMKQVWVCNCGNAMAVVANKKGGKIYADILTEDHTPRSKTEKERIYLMGGEVRQFQKGDKERVCVRCRNYPGLTSTRSIGDLVATKIGVTAEPSMQVKEKNLKDHDAIVIGCEVFWENISPEEAGELVFLYGSKDVRDATKALHNTVKKKAPNGLIHDLAFIIVFGLY